VQNGADIRLRILESTNGSGLRFRAVLSEGSPEGHELVRV
jgi:hypothetical protein